ncbi:MAG: (d)CMP kinase [Clostridia bacterium]|nr:(d)CMP kinase [Clostridia bacterium]
MFGNIFIVGPVATGKNTLLNKLKSNYNIEIVDTGQLYRYIAYIVNTQTDINPDFEKINLNDESEIQRVLHAVFKWNRTIEHKLENLSIKGGCLHEGDAPLNAEILYKKEVNLLVSKLAKLPFLREKILKYLNKSLPQNCDNAGITGHNIREIDTTKYTIIFLDVSDEEAAKRLYSRNPGSYDSMLDAYKEVVERNKSDDIETTRNAVKSVYNGIYVDTTNKGIEDVYSEVVEKIEDIEKRRKAFAELQQQESIDKENFEWLYNPFIEVFKVYARRFIDEIVKSNPCISRTDLEYQTMIGLCSNELQSLISGDINIIEDINRKIKTRDANDFDLIPQYIKTKQLIINVDAIGNEVYRQFKKLKQLYVSNNVEHIMSELNKEPEDVETLGKSNSRKVIYKEVSKEQSAFLAKFCHYLHTPRNDEYRAFGAFYEGDAFPMAWVSYSKQDRDYKKQLLDYLQIESHNTVEMTRAWRSNSAPKNIMSSLFQKSFDYISKEFKSDKENQGKLQAITTAINPNLGFNASSFKGCNFFVYALRPARFTYGVKDGQATYMTRRSIIESGMVFLENQFNILPLNEMIVCLDKTRERNVISGNVYVMDEKTYDRNLDKCKEGESIGDEEGTSGH